jgi:hypothetical protein
LAIVNSAAVNIGVQAGLSYPGAHSFEYMHRSGITGSYGSLFFSFLRDCHIAFHTSCSNLHSHQQCRCASFPQSTHQHLFLFVVLMTAILTGIK